MDTTSTSQNKTVLDKTFAPSSRQIKYLNRDFDSLKQDLINFSKQYYSKTYQDFNDASPGMMFIEQAAYVGDVLSFYNDYLFKESMFEYSQERKNVIQLAKYLGYISRPSRPAVVSIDVYQLIPAKMLSSGEYQPNYRYAMKIKSGMRCLSQTGTSFLTTGEVDFSSNTAFSPCTASVYSRDADGNPTYYLLKKSVDAYSGEVKSVVVGTTTTPNLKIQLPDSNVIKIMSVVDDDNNNWYQVDYLAQDLVSIPVENSKINFSERFYSYSDTVPSVMRFLRTDRRFAIDVDENNITSLQFGPAISNTTNQIIIPSYETIGPGFTNLIKYNIPLNSTFYINSPSYGSSPQNTNLTVTYVVGGGMTANSPTNSITKIASIEFQDSVIYLSDESALVSTIKNSIHINNETPATGGSGEESVYEIKKNALATFSSQNRAVTSQDYMSVVYGMPKEYGRVAKVFVSSESSLSINNETVKKGLIDENQNIIVDENTNTYRRVAIDNSNPFGINLYVLTYDLNKNLTNANEALLHNLKNYVSQYRVLSDRINIVDGYIINIGVNFSILTYPNYNKTEILSNCITAVANFFDIEKWQFMQPINLSQLQLEIANVEGVQSIANLDVVNIVSADGSGTDYSLCEYDITSATRNNIIYPPVDPAIFEIKNPNVDISGQIIS